MERTSATILSLPDEILCSIAEYLTVSVYASRSSRASIRACFIKTCRRIRAACLHLIYRDISVRYYNGSDLPSHWLQFEQYSAHVKNVKMIVIANSSPPPLHNLVQKFTFLSRFDYHFSATYEQNSFFRIIWTCCQLQHLKHMRISICREYEPEKWKMYRDLYAGSVKEPTTGFYNKAEIVNMIKNLSADGSQERLCQLRRLDVDFKFHYRRPDRKTVLFEDYFGEIPLLCRMLAPVVPTLEWLYMCVEIGNASSTRKNVDDSTLHGIWRLKRMVEGVRHWGKWEHLGRSLIEWVGEGLEEGDSDSV